MLKMTRRISIQRYLYAMCRPAHRHTIETKAYMYNTMGTSGEQKPRHTCKQTQRNTWQVIMQYRKNRLTALCSKLAWNTLACQIFHSIQHPLLWQSRWVGIFMVLGLMPKMAGKASEFIKRVLIRSLYSRAVRLGPMWTINCILGSLSSKWLHLQLVLVKVSWKLVNHAILVKDQKHICIK